jgi:uncharacterized membrane protein
MPSAGVVQSRTRDARRRTQQTKKGAALPRRVDAVDVLRGVAIALMVAYHFCFDLNYFGAIHTSFNDQPFWLASRALIVSMFLGLVGASLVLAANAGRRRSFWRRNGMVAACCALVSLSSFSMFPQRWIFFGVLHFILLASFLGPFFLRWHRANLVLGATLVALGVWVRHPVFDQPWLQWVGLMTFKPATEDYVPLLPWFGVVLIGMFAAQVLLAARGPLMSWQASRVPSRYAALAGRHSLAIYMLHQPLLLGVLYMWFAVARTQG